MKIFIYVSYCYEFFIENLFFLQLVFQYKNIN